MEALNWTAVAAIFAILAVLGGFMRYVVHIVEKNNAVWASRLDKAKRDRDETAGDLDKLKDEVYREYARKAEIAEWRKEMREATAKIFSRLDDLAKELHLLNGRFQERVRDA